MLWARNFPVTARFPLRASNQARSAINSERDIMAIAGSSGGSAETPAQAEQTTGRPMPKRPERQKARVRETPASGWKPAKPLRDRSPAWDHAVSNAAARVDAGWVLQETRCHQAAAEELAALLCAYKA